MMDTHSMALTWFQFIGHGILTTPQPGKNELLETTSESRMTKPWMDTTFGLALLKNSCHILAETPAAIGPQKSTIATANAPIVLLMHQL